MQTAFSKETYQMKARVVFIHLGDARADHLIANILRFEEIFPGIEKTLIVSSTDFASRVSSKFPRINLHLYKGSDSTERIFAKSVLRLDFRQGFWRYSLERLFAFVELHELYPEEKFIHFESDVLVFPNFPWNEILSLDGMYWTRFNEERDVSAILGSSNFQHSSKFREELTLELVKNNHHTDMTVLRELSQSGKIQFSLLPSLDVLQSRDPALLNVFNDGIFDPASIGMWLTGQDPRNKWGVKVLHQEMLSGGSLVNPGSCAFEISPEGNLFIRQNGGMIPVFNLHVHSKEVKLFGRNWAQNLQRYVNLSRRKRVIRQFSMKVLVGLLIENYRQKSLLRYFLTFPPVYHLRMKITDRLKQS
jgi:hypothetical protein